MEELRSRQPAINQGYENQNRTGRPSVLNHVGAEAFPSCRRFEL